MEFFFVGIATMVAALVVATGVALLRRGLRIRRAWHGGRTSEARCLRVLTNTTGGDSPTTYRSRVYEFTTREGRTVRITGNGGPDTVLEGDTVMVRYAADAPEHATAEPYRPVALAVGMGCIGLFMAAALAVCVTVMVIALTAGSPDEPEVPDDFPTGLHF
ncbi:MULTISPECIES: DUF3592 domain-containing protein [unclassified Streptomyces]|uniref:DUF3592 domain-containing protein n=1 Tax=unclassified Streptomyces TaxID=2593676 RepID=UPI000DC2340C|nr:MULTISPECIES: DUF3592 domain-containing protein [unclassified Streptomyces]RAJ82961.1 hypothetical protein K377_04015 [Streptomyces sp. PsTaAH-137]